MSRSNRAACTLALVAIAIALAACNTTKGAGEDIEKLGEKMQDSAERNGAK